MTAAGPRLLRLADSAFPGGGFAFSAGLEGALADGLVSTEQDLTAFVHEHLALRWHRQDRVLLRLAWPSTGARDDADHVAETTTSLSWARDASRKAGRALLGTFAGLGCPAAGDYLDGVVAGRLYGHLPVSQAVCFRGAGMDRGSGELLSAWHAASGIVSAGVRLTLVGHLGAQRVLSALERPVADVLAMTPPAEPGGFSAFAEIASGRIRPGPRMFAS